jgi:hypothetical protein
MRSINQSDKHELGHQVDHMRQIYSGASRTVVWLGPDVDDYGKLAIETIQRLGEMLCQIIGLPESELGQLHDFTSLSRRLDEYAWSIDFINDSEWLALK